MKRGIVLTVFFVFGIIGCFGPGRCFSEEEKGPIGWWKFDEGTGAMATDSSGQGNNGRLIGTNTSTEWVDGKIGKALCFHGNFKKGTGVKVPGMGKKYDFSKGLTVQAWIKSMDSIPRKTDGSHRQEIVSNFQVDYGPGFGLVLSIGKTGYIQFISGDKNYWKTILGVHTLATIRDNTWYHVAATYDGSVYKIYLNGELADTSDPDLPLLKGLDDIYIGTLGPYYPFNGIIDEVKIYDYARSHLSILREARLEEYQ